MNGGMAVRIGGKSAGFFTGTESVAWCYLKHF